MTNAEAAAGFRQLAELLENNPEMQQPYHGCDVEMSFYCHTRERFVATVKAFGSGKKEDGGSKPFPTIDFTPNNFPLRVEVSGFKDGIGCQKVTRTEHVPETVLPARAETRIPAYERTVEEYVCGPILAEVGASHAE